MGSKDTESKEGWLPGTVDEKTGWQFRSKYVNIQL